MNYHNEITKLLYIYKANPSNANYARIEILIEQYKSNPPDQIKRYMQDRDYIEKLEDKDYIDNATRLSSIVSPDLKNKPKDLGDWFQQFTMCPTDNTARYFKEALNQFKLDNPDGVMEK